MVGTFNLTFISGWRIIPIKSTIYSAAVYCRLSKDDGQAGESVYFYKKNLQGDITAIYSSTGTKVAEYLYDAWGNCTIVTDIDGIATLNLIRYRGYYYDTETGLYYLNSRYYDPNIARFINADCFINNSLGILGVNLFTYSINNPINMIDVSGYTPKYITDQRNNYLVDGTRMQNISFGIGNIAKNGCGAIAAYNVMVTNNNNVKFNNVKNELIMFGGLLGFGKLGTNPFNLSIYLKTKYLFVHTDGPITNLWGIKSELSEAVIVMFSWDNFEGAHFVSGISTGKSQEGGEFVFYNTFLEDNNNESIDGKAMSIWKFLDILEFNNCTPLYFIGVNGQIGV